MSQTAQTTPAAAATTPRRQHRGLQVVALLMVVATAIGVLAYWRFVVSDGYLREDLARAAVEGKQQTADQCVDQTLRWAASCRAMKSLCFASSSLVTHRCLDARDRSAYCQTLGAAHRDTRFGYKECKARGVTRQNKKICAAAYRAIAAHCSKQGMPR